jgi:hypothetical protein
MLLAKRRVLCKQIFACMALIIVPFNFFIFDTRVVYSDNF